VQSIEAGLEETGSFERTPNLFGFRLEMPYVFKPGAGTPVVVGGQDQKCAALGAAIRPGVAAVSLGTASAISCLIDKPVLDAERRNPDFSLCGSGILGCGVHRKLEQGTLRNHAGRPGRGQALGLK
jgi:hypothetical protein